MFVVSPSINVGPMIQAARDFKGVHDFQSFRANNCSAKTTERTILLSEVARDESGFIVYTVHGKGFLKQIIRILTGTLVEVGMGRLSPDDMPRILAARSRSVAGPTPASRWADA